MMPTSPAALFSGVFLGLVGTVMVIHAKKQLAPVPGIAGIALCLAPMFIGSLLLMWTFALAILGGVYWHARQG